MRENEHIEGVYFFFTLLKLFHWKNKRSGGVTIFGNEDLRTSLLWRVDFFM